MLVIGPGLGRDDHMQSCARIAFELAKGFDQMSVVVDADGLWLVQVSLRVVSHVKRLLKFTIAERAKGRHGLAGDTKGDPHAKCHGVQAAMYGHGEYIDFF